MKVSKKSWHYRLIFWYDHYVPQNLCDYFWALMKSMLIVGLLAVTAPVWGPAMAVHYLFERYDDWRFEKMIADHESGPPPPKPPGIIMSFLRAKKQKVCPLIEFTE